MTTRSDPPAPLPPSEIERLAGVAMRAWRDDPHGWDDAWVSAVSAVLADPGVAAAFTTAGRAAGLEEGAGGLSDEDLQRFMTVAYKLSDDVWAIQDDLDLTPLQRESAIRERLDDYVEIVDRIQSALRDKLLATTLRARAGKGE